MHEASGTLPPPRLKPGAPSAQGSVETRKTRRLTIKLPDDHYIFSLPAKDRIALTRQAIEPNGIYMTIQQIAEKMARVEEIYEKIARMEKLLTEVGSINLHGSVGISLQYPQSTEDTIKKVLDYFDD